LARELGVQVITTYKDVPGGAVLTVRPTSGASACGEVCSDLVVRLGDDGYIVDDWSFLPNDGRIVTATAPDGSRHRWTIIAE
jgi:hypothetical protein